jgi:hypothetical protein
MPLSTTETTLHAHIEHATGFLGCAHALAQVGLALFGLSINRKLNWSETQSCHIESSLDNKAILITTWAPHGQYIALILEKEEA